MKTLSTDLIENFVEVSYNKKLLAIAKPLQLINIDFFTFIRRSRDGYQYELTINPNWSKHFYANKFFNLAPFRDSYHLYNNGYYLWTTHSNQVISDALLKTEKIASGITIVYKFNEYNEFYHFGSSKLLEQQSHIYFSNLDILERFVLYFRSNAKPLFKLAEKNALIVPYQNIDTDFVLDRSRETEEFLKALKLTDYALCNEGQEVRLSAREIQCLRWYVQGKTADEIGQILAISSRTVEAHISKVKTKLNCYKQSALAYKYAELQLPRFKKTIDDYL